MFTIARTPFSSAARATFAVASIRPAQADRIREVQGVDALRGPVQGTEMLYIAFHDVPAEPPSTRRVRSAAMALRLWRSACGGGRVDR
ncbi:hypothetical protein SAMN05216489_01515 [Streptomyces sp. 3213]|nr:hypothetical protein SAMN05216489_01515 [Streptomyces sp. 3213] [Streptomyces sp. 3213.3]